MAARRLRTDARLTASLSPVWTANGGLYPQGSDSFDVAGVLAPLAMSKGTGGYRRSTQEFPFPGGRHAQRALFDITRDLLPVRHGLRPTIRTSEFDVPSQLRDEATARAEVRSVLDKGLPGRSDDLQRQHRTTGRFVRRSNNPINYIDVRYYSGLLPHDRPTRPHGRLLSACAVLCRPPSL
jgi:hypothetical protein